jgi:nicotinate-nucleotide pyrophosphorylase (carboxylating)
MTPTAAVALGRIMPDVREEILQRVPASRVVASISAEAPGVVSGVTLARAEAARLGVVLESLAGEGTVVRRGGEVLRLAGTPRQVVMAEEILMGLLAKPSGIATRARAFVEGTGGRPRVVSGGWKKMPAAMKDMIRPAVAAGGASPRILPGPFAYLDKNYVALLGGIAPALGAVAHLRGLARVIQVKGRYSGVPAEAVEAAEHGADVVFVDTGRMDDVAAVSGALSRRGLRGRVQLAFGGGVTLEDLPSLRQLDLDILDVGRAIVDAPLLDLRLDILANGREG